MEIPLITGVLCPIRGKGRDDMDKPDKAAEAADRIVRHHFGCRADEIREIGHRTNNFVFSFAVADGR